MPASLRRCCQSSSKREPATQSSGPVAERVLPPLTEEAKPLAVFAAPPLTEAIVSLAAQLDPVGSTSPRSPEAACALRAAVADAEAQPSVGESDIAEGQADIR